MIYGGVPWEGRGARYHCDYPTGTQLAEAVAFLHVHRQFVSLITIDFGGNDVAPCVFTDTVDGNPIGTVVFTGTGIGTLAACLYR